MAAKLERDRPALIARRIKPANRLLALWLAPLAFLGLFYFYPLASILGTSFARLEQGDTNPRPLDCKVPLQHIGRDTVAVLAFGCAAEASYLFSTQPLSSHQARHAVLALHSSPIFRST